MHFDIRPWLCGLGISVFAWALTWLAAPAPIRGAATNPTGVGATVVAYPKLPLSFEPHTGWGRTSDAFVSRGAGYGLRIDQRGATVRLRSRTADAHATVRLEFLGAAEGARVSGGSGLPGKANYLLGNDPSKWRVNVPTFREVRCLGIYPGVDVLYYGGGEQLEYDVVVAPGADPGQVRWQVRGAERLELDAKGDLLLHTSAGALRQHRPYIYQERDGRREEIHGAYRLMASAATGDIAGLEIGEYDRSRPLVIDPVLSYSTYLGGAGSEKGLALAVDAAGSAYITGETVSTDFPTTAGALQTSQGGISARGDVFISKLDPNGAALVYSTYLGGGGGDVATGIAVDQNGGAYVTGRTDSGNFPVANAIFATPRGDQDAFAAKLSPAGDALDYSTYLGGQAADGGLGIAVAASGEASIIGRTASANFPVVNAFQPERPSAQAIWQDAFVARLSAAGTSLIFSTYMGGERDEMILNAGGVAVDADGATYVAGGTDSADFPVTPGAYDQTLEGEPGSTDGFIAKFDATGVLAFATYLGGDASDGITGIGVTGSGQSVVTGVTASPNFPMVNAVRGVYSGSDDAFAAKLESDGTALVYSTFLGGSGQDKGLAVAVDSAGGACVVGTTFSPNFPIARALQPPGGSFDAFIVRLNSLGTTLAFSSYLGGFSQDAATGVAIDPSGEVYVGGHTGSTAFPLAFPLQADLRGLTDAFVARISEGSAPPVFPTGLTADSLCNTSVGLRWTDNSDDEDAFEIERRTGAGPFTPIAAVAENTVVYEDSGLLPNTAYVYRVRATNEDGASGYSNELPVTTLVTTVTAPSELTVEVVSHNSLRLTWQDNSPDEAGFRIERATNPGGAFELVQTVAANLETFMDTGLTSETSYSYRVRAAAGGCDSPPSPIASAQTPSQPVTAPSGLAGIALSESQISLTWQDNSANETGFRIERLTGDEFEERAVVDTNVVAFVDAGLAPTTGYTYRIRALNGSGASLPSNTARITTPAPPRGILKVAKTVNFGTVRLGQTRTKTLVIRNGSRNEQMRLTIGAVTAPFTATGAGAHTVLIGGNRTITVTFTPTARGKSTTKLVLLSSDTRRPRAEVTFTGKGK